MSQFKRRTGIRRAAAMASAALACMIMPVAASAQAAPSAASDFRARLPQDEVIYFLLPDRFENGDRANDTGGIAGGRL
ncbi:MAG: alpha-amylase, partial [Brevundimonas sp.]|nr:alpha-amylase [Brevundimonas sp.]